MYYANTQQYYPTVVMMPVSTGNTFPISFYPLTQLVCLGGNAPQFVTLDRNISTSMRVIPSFSQHQPLLTQQNSGAIQFAVAANASISPELLKKVEVARAKPEEVRPERMDWRRTIDEEPPGEDKVLRSDSFSRKAKLTRVRSTSNRMQLMLVEQSAVEHCSQRVRKWQWVTSSKRTNTIYDCSCGKRKPIHDRKSIVDHIKSLHRETNSC